MDTPITRAEHEEFQTSENIQLIKLQQSIHFGTTVIPVEYAYIYLLTGFRESIFKITVKEENLTRKDIEALKANRSPIYLFENGKLKDTLEGYYAGFKMEYSKGEYKIQLLRNDPERKPPVSTTEYEKPSLMRFVEKMILRKGRI